MERMLFHAFSVCVLNFPSEFASRISGMSMLKTDENNSFHLQSLEAAKQRTPAQFMIAVWFK